MIPPPRPKPLRIPANELLRISLVSWFLIVELGEVPYETLSSSSEGDDWLLSRYIIRLL